MPWIFIANFCLAAPYVELGLLGNIYLDVCNLCFILKGKTKFPFE